MLVFNFHHVEVEPKHRDRKLITISPKGLRTFIRTLRALGMHIVSLQDVLKPESNFHQGKNCDKDVILTFDDGFENNYTEALPVLEEENCPATIFILPGRLRGTNEWDQAHLPEDERDQLMSLDQILEMAKSPVITFGSHGMLHQKMAQLPEEDRYYEMNTSYELIEGMLGDKFVPVFAYPWGNYSAETIETIKKTRYQYALTTETGRWTSQSGQFEVPRYSIYDRDSNPLILLSKLYRHNILSLKADKTESLSFN